MYGYETFTQDITTTMASFTINLATGFPLII